MCLFLLIVTSYNLIVSCFCCYCLQFCLNATFYILQALESFLLRCPRDISAYCDEILHLTLEFLSYDPNFTDNMEEDTDDENNEEDEDGYATYS